MLFNEILSTINKAVESYIPTLSNNNDNDTLLDEKNSIHSTKSYDNGMLEKLKRSGSNRSLFKLSIKKGWNSSSPCITTATVVTPPNPTKAAPLWKEQVDSNIKAELPPFEIHRQEIIYEIIRTEKVFVEDIRYLIEVNNVVL